MSERREPGFDQVVAMVLQIGAFAGFFVMLAGLIDGMFVHSPMPLQIEKFGVLIMLATPVVRVFVAGVLFFRERDWRYGTISLGLLLILLLGSVFGIGEH